MKDQHEKIKGYRDLTEKEVELISKIEDYNEKLEKIILHFKSLRLDVDHEDCISLSNYIYKLNNEGVEVSPSDTYTTEERLKSGLMWLTDTTQLYKKYLN